MPIEVVLPQLGLSTESARVATWLVSVDDRVEAGQTIAEVETDKATVDIPAPATGFVREILVPVGEEASMGRPIALMTASLEEPLSSSLAPPPRPAQPPAVGPAQGRIPALPAARRRARELGVDLADVTGTGPSGAITVRDVEQAAAGPTPRPSARAPSARAPSAMREAIARTVTESWAIPQFWMERVVAAGRTLASLEQRYAGAPSPPTFVDLLLLACGRALQQHPAFRSARTADGVSISYLVATSEGLLTPSMGGVERLSLPQIASRRRELVARARAGNLTAQDLSGADFSVSNLGPLGVDRFMALVPPGQAGILAVGRIVQGPGEATVSLVLTLDHRVVDGASGARFLADIAAVLESPEDAVLT